MSPQLAGLSPLNDALASALVETEVLLIGGALMSVVFRADSPSRRPEHQFADTGVLSEMASRVAAASALPSDWLSTAARLAIGAEGVAGRGWEGSHLRVYSPRPAYALALKCAHLGHASTTEQASIEADIRYLIRLMGLTTTAAALGAVQPYFTARQLPVDLSERLTRLLALGGSGTLALGRG